jgi:hypothetical protein
MPFSQQKWLDPWTQPTHNHASLPQFSPQEIDNLIVVHPFSEHLIGKWFPTMGLNENCGVSNWN